MANPQAPLYVNNSAGTTAKHVLYENFVLENKMDEFLTTLVDMNNYLTPDYSLAENAGMKKVINKYTATGDVERLEMGQGNSAEISVSFESSEYVVGTYQQKFVYFDEQEMNDPMVVEVGLRKMADNMVNSFTRDAITEWNQADLVKYECRWSYDDVVDAISLYPHEEQEESLALLISPQLKAAFRKNLKEYLSYVEPNVRTGYIGSVCGVPVIVSAALNPDNRIVSEPTAFLVDRRAVTSFIKKGVEIEQERDADTRKNTIYSRKVGVVALTDATRVVKMVESSQP